MKLCNRLLCILLATIILFSFMVSSVYADDSVIDDTYNENSRSILIFPPMVYEPGDAIASSNNALSIRWYLRWRDDNGSLVTPTYLKLQTENGSNIKGQTHSYETSTFYSPSQLYGEYIQIERGGIIEDNILIEKGQDFDITLKGLFNNIMIHKNNAPWNHISANLNNLQNLRVAVYDSNNKIEYLEDAIYWSKTEGGTDFIFNVRIADMPYDVYRISIVWEYYLDDIYDGLDAYRKDSSYTYERWFGFSPDHGEVLFKRTDGSGGILGFLKKILNGILSIPKAIWNLIESGLQKLFVPSESYMSSYSDKWDTMLASRLGAVYQVCDIITDFFGGISEADKTDTISMPEVTLNFDETPFTFGGYDVKIVPEGFGTVVEICKKIISIVCTYMFINGLVKRYDEVIGK